MEKTSFIFTTLCLKHAHTGLLSGFQSFRQVPTSKPLIDSELCNSSQTNKHWKKRTRTTNQVSSSKSSETASVPILSRKKPLQRLKKKSVPTKTSVRLKTPLISSNSKCLSSQNKGQLKITKKDQWLHKLVFEDGGLPDGTEVAYYGRGQKLLRVTKRALEFFVGAATPRSAHHNLRSMQARLLAGNFTHTSTLKWGFSP
ncbi:hypothetical protein K1719_021795 [Acacia pycnantha]|nr:hypothetical protein K1719_021795 [Acacia pycnantha]